MGAFDRLATFGSAESQHRGSAESQHRDTSDVQHRDSSAAQHRDSTAVEHGGSVGGPGVARWRLRQPSRFEPRSVGGGHADGAGGDGVDDLAIETTLPGVDGRGTGGYAGRDSPWVFDNDGSRTHDLRGSHHRLHDDSHLKSQGASEDRERRNAADDPCSGSDSAADRGLSPTATAATLANSPTLATDRMGTAPPERSGRSRAAGSRSGANPPTGAHPATGADHHAGFRRGSGTHLTTGTQPRTLQAGSALGHDEAGPYATLSDRTGNLGTFDGQSHDGAAVAEWRGAQVSEARPTSRQIEGAVRAELLTQGLIPPDSKLVAIRPGDTAEPDPRRVTVGIEHGGSGELTVQIGRVVVVPPAKPERRPTAAPQPSQPAGPSALSQFLEARRGASR